MELLLKKNSYFLYLLENTSINIEGNEMEKLINFGFFSSYKAVFYKKTL
jgi:hypothetical protein